ncbi:MAG TPA: TerB family tellurite resistance protein [Gemmatimonas sp.]|nr:TerB family tellurite resistance protein [Gemmatimonas sp.]
MLDAFRRLIRDSVQDSPATQNSGSPNVPRDVRLAACALLVELACADGDFSDTEQRQILAILERHFGVDAEGARALMGEATVANRDAVDHFVFTRQIVKDYDVAQRIVLAEMMWQVILADGALDGQESYLIRKLAGLLELEPAFLAAARRGVSEM